MKKQTTKKAAPKKATAKKAAPKKQTSSKKSVAVKKEEAPKKHSKADEKLIHQIDWLTADVVEGYFTGVDKDILSKSAIKELKETTVTYQELFDYLCSEKQIAPDFAEFLLFYMHTLVFTGAGEKVFKEWKEDHRKSKTKKKK